MASFYANRLIWWLVMLLVVVILLGVALVLFFRLGRPTQRRGFSSHRGCEQHNIHIYQLPYYQRFTTTLLN